MLRPKSNRLRARYQNTLVLATFLVHKHHQERERERESFFLGSIFISPLRFGPGCQFSRKVSSYTQGERERSPGYGSVRVRSPGHKDPYRTTAFVPPSSSLWVGPLCRVSSVRGSDLPRKCQNPFIPPSLSLSRSIAGLSRFLLPPQRRRESYSCHSDSILLQPLPQREPPTVQYLARCGKTRRKKDRAPTHVHTRTHVPLFHFPRENRLQSESLVLNLFFFLSKTRRP